MPCLSLAVCPRFSEVTFAPEDAGPAPIIDVIGGRGDTKLGAECDEVDEAGVVTSELVACSSWCDSRPSLLLVISPALTEGAAALTRTDGTGNGTAAVVDVPPTSRPPPSQTMPSGMSASVQTSSSSKWSITGRSAAQPSFWRACISSPQQVCVLRYLTSSRNKNEGSVMWHE
mmetsp:Transcript_32996/g.97364  ORF Transcript_32996/g.97364 Transcript_32996/m.97364 type:complete len:173 (-) Transcript_32996:179-697(-)